jgi:uncharacterized membrane protein
MDEDGIIMVLQRLHAASGFVALVMAPLAMLSRKGADAHRRWGRVFFWSMAVVAVTAVVLGVLRSNWVMAMVAVFSFHLIASGYRSLYHKRLHEGQGPQPLDLVLQGSAAVVNGGLFLWGAMNLIFGHRNPMHVVFLVFGLVSVAVVLANLHRFQRRSADKHAWLYGHMSGFLGGYIATVSAFSAVNLDMIRPVWLQWLWPTLLGTPLIVLWTRYYKRRFAKGRRARDLFIVRLK